MQSLYKHVQYIKWKEELSLDWLPEFSNQQGTQTSSNVQHIRACMTHMRLHMYMQAQRQV